MKRNHRKAKPLFKVISLRKVKRVKRKKGQHES
jgi:hypothetical protein